ncbi:MAG: phosphodiester glycosidase family protein [Actinomycetota bacterium]
MKPARCPLALASVLAVALAVASVVPAGAEDGASRSREAAAARRPIVKTKKIAPGLTYTKIVEKKVPRRTFVLTMDPTRALTLDVTLTESAMPAQRILSRTARAHDALAAVNGDYSGDGDPFHPLAQDGELVQTSSQQGTLFAMTTDETQTYFANPDVSVVVTDRDSGIPYRIARWNDGQPAPGEIVGYSPLGGTLEAPPAFTCAVRLLPTGPPSLAPATGVERDYVVDAAGCPEEAMARNGGVVLAAPPATDEAIQLLALTPGTPMRLHWTVGFAGVFDAVGGAPLLVENGNLVGNCNSACGSHPRTGIGVTAAGKILLVVVDGRQPRWSLGPTMTEFARIMQGLGAVTALNLDGGGSSTMVVQGKVVNRPSDGHERAISNAILVLPGADPGEA